MQYNNNQANCFLKIYNNFLESCYLKTLSIIKSPEESLNILYKVIDKIVVFDYQVGNLTSINKVASKYYLQLLKNYYKENKDRINNEDSENIDYTIPEKLYLLNFDAHKLFNETDNLILINMLINKMELKDLSKFINNSEDYILTRYNQLIKQIYIIYTEKVKRLKNT